MAGTFRDLLAWQRSMNLVKLIYRSTAGWPRAEIYGLTSQIRRAAVSVPSNIAEGKGRHSRREYYQFLCRARGSLFEVETQLEIARDLEFLDQVSAEELISASSATARVLNGLITSLERTLEDDPTADSRKPTARQTRA